MTNEVAPRWRASWIWCATDTPQRIAFISFLRQVDYQGRPAILHITADSRHVLYVNGEHVGPGPVRARPAHWRYDSYDLALQLRDSKNALAGTILDWHNSEFIQPNGCFNFAEGMNNSFRYICGVGSQTYQAYARVPLQLSHPAGHDGAACNTARPVLEPVHTYPQVACWRWQEA